MNHIPDAAMNHCNGGARLRKAPQHYVISTTGASKRTDRLFAMATELRKVGAEVEEGHDFIRITPPATLQFADIATYNDHRMAMVAGGAI